MTFTNIYIAVDNNSYKPFNSNLKLLNSYLIQNLIFLIKNNGHLTNEASEYNKYINIIRFSLLHLKIRSLNKSFENFIELQFEDNLCNRDML